MPMAQDGHTMMVDVKCDIVTIDGFSGHSDRRQLLDYVNALNPKPRRIICHHGDDTVCNEFRKTLTELQCTNCCPQNLESIRLL